MNKNPQQLCNDWNRVHPVGTLVKFWRGAKEGEPSGQGTTYAPAEVLSGHTAVVWIESCRGCVALTHVEAIPGTEVVADVDYFDPSPKADETGGKA